jgi:hypothetical protein
MIEVKPGWQKTKRDSMLTPGVTEMAYLCMKAGEAPWAVVADHAGVTIRGESPKFTSEGGAALDDFAWVLSDAMREYMKLRRSRIQSVGDNEINKINR